MARAEVTFDFSGTQPSIRVSGTKPVVLASGEPMTDMAKRLIKPTGESKFSLLHFSLLALCAYRSTSDFHLADKTVSREDLRSLPGWRDRTFGSPGTLAVKVSNLFGKENEKFTASPPAGEEEGRLIQWTKRPNDKHDFYEFNMRRYYVAENSVDALAAFLRGEVPTLVTTDAEELLSRLFEGMKIELSGACPLNASG